MDHAKRHRTKTVLMVGGWIGDQEARWIDAVSCMCATRPILFQYSFGEMITGVRVKDFVFRNFWERDECHGLLEKLRVEAQESENTLEEAASVEEEVGDDEDEVEGDDDCSSHGNVSICEVLFGFVWFSMVCAFLFGGVSWVLCSQPYI